MSQLGQASEESREVRNTCWEAGDEAKRTPVRQLQPDGEEARTKTRNRDFRGLELDPKVRFYLPLRDDFCSRLGDRQGEECQVLGLTQKLHTCTLLVSWSS